MKKKIKIKKIENEIKKFSKDRSKVSREINRKRKELIILLILFFILLYFILNTKVVNNSINTILNFLIFSIFSFVVYREFYLEICQVKNKNLKKFKILLRIFTVVFVIIYFLLIYYLFIYKIIS